MNTTHIRLEALVGGRAFHVAGVISLFLAAAFALRYSFDHQWISELQRCILGLVAGLAAMAFGATRRDDVWLREGGLILGAGVIDLAAWAAAVSYHVVPVSPAFAAMAAAGTLLAFAAMRFRSERLALAGFLAAELAPALLFDGTPHHWELALYLLGSARVFLSVAERAGFRFVPYAAFVAALAYAPQFLPAGDWNPFEGLAVETLLSVQLAIAFAKLRHGAVAASVANAAAFAAVTAVLFFGQRTEFGCAYVALAAICAGVAYATNLPARLRHTYETLALVAVTIAVPALYLADVVGPMYAIEGALLAIFGRFSALRTTGALLVGAALWVTAATQMVPQAMPLFNPRTFDLATEVLALVIMAGSARRYCAGPAFARAIDAMLPVAANLLALIALTCDVSDHSGASRAAVTALWAVYGLGQLGYALRRQAPALRAQALAILACATLKFCAFDLLQLEAAARIMAATALGAALVIASLWMRRRTPAAAH